jgi:hypothetical protein
MMVTTMAFVHHRVMNAVFHFKCPQAFFWWGQPASNTALTPFVVEGVSPGASRPGRWVTVPERAALLSLRPGSSWQQLKGWDGSTVPGHDVGG